MVDLLPARPVLTPADIASRLQSDGLDALGLAMPALATAWAGTAPTLGDVDENAMTIALTGARAPFQGIIQYEGTTVSCSGPNGAPLTGPVQILRLHPEAALKLDALAGSVLGSAVIRPTPVAMVIRGVAVPAPAVPLKSAEAGEPLPFSAGSHIVSFHDDRGLPIDPLAVASLFLALQQALPALAHGASGQPALGSPGGLSGIAGLASRVRFHIVDPHGHGFSPPRIAATLSVITGAGATPVDDTGVGTWPSGATIGRSASEQAQDDIAPRLFWGFARNATLARSNVSVPTSPVALGNEFFRLTAVDLDWHLLGNRTDATVLDVPGDDASVPTYALPVVRPFVPNAAYLVDAQDALGAMGQLLTGFPQNGVDSLMLLCSPVIDESLALPPAPGAQGHWPQFPAGPATMLPASVDPTAGITGTWASGTGGPHDAIVTIAADVVPDGTHVRVYPRRFQTIRSIGERPSFVRDDGGSGIAAAGTASSILVRNPFGLLPGEPRPAPAELMVDLVVTGRDGSRRIMSEVAVPLGADQPFVPTTFGGTAALQQPAIAALSATFGSTSVAPSGLFGIPELPVAGALPPSPVDMVRAFASESTRPRQGPRQPSQARFETVLAVGAAVPGPLLVWNAVLTGARWSEESRSAQPELGDPGNPAGPDVVATGFRAGGQLAQDLALHAMKRAQPVLPIAANTVGWLIATAGNNWAPAPLDPPTATMSGVMLETVAPISDSPELSLLPEAVLTQTVQQLVNAAAGALGVGAPAVTLANESQIRARLQREAVTARVGQRDALWSLRRAIHQAREFVYIESAQFAKTGDPASAVDLVGELDEALVDNPRLLVMIAVPRTPDFDQATTKYEPYVRAALAQRTSAIESLTAGHRERVAAFHPVGFPGRSTFIRSTTVVVDDVYALVGSSHFRRRGMTFDGACDVATIDRQLDSRGASAGIQRFRQQLMASRLAVPVPATPAATTAIWTRLSSGHGAFGVLTDLLSAGGLGRCQPVWAGPTDTEVIPKSDAESDPAGGDTSIFSALWKLAGGD
ncbi:hypothetical protein ABIB15_002718 [Marisediminicola sp. UYEF4]|uniref:hypothetical protein n=1 Tax=Marisediminicola sp. UYEF4 TaxID=1756384 RepID=UPI003395F3C8